MIQIVALAGSLMILAAYAGNQTARMRAEDRSYIVLNLAGAGILAVVAAIEEQWGFLLLEAVWTLVSLWALLRPRRPAVT